MENGEEAINKKMKTMKRNKKFQKRRTRKKNKKYQRGRRKYQKR